MCSVVVTCRVSCGHACTLSALVDFALAAISVVRTYGRFRVDGGILFGLGHDSRDAKDMASATMAT